MLDAFYELTNQDVGSSNELSTNVNLEDTKGSKKRQYHQIKTSPIKLS